MVAAPLLAFKLWASLLVLFFSPTGESAMSLLMVYGWPWLVAFGVLVAGPTIAWSRLVRVRARRKRLQRSEWMLEETSPKRRAGERDAEQSAQWPSWEAASRGDGGS